MYDQSLESIATLNCSFNLEYIFEMLRCSETDVTFPLFCKDEDGMDYVEVRCSMWQALELPGNPLSKK